MASKELPPVEESDLPMRDIGRAYAKMYTDTKLASDKKYGHLVDATQAGLSPEAYHQYSAMAQRMKLLDAQGKPPAIYVDKSGGTFLEYPEVPEAMAVMTQEGQKFVIVTKGFIKKYNARQQVAYLGHELTHHASGDATAEGNAREGRVSSISMEYNADIKGSGPLGSCDPEALRQALQIGERAVLPYEMQKELQNYMKAHPHATMQEFEKYKEALPRLIHTSETDHPSFARRDQYLAEAAKHPDPVCVARNEDKTNQR